MKDEALKRILTGLCVSSAHPQMANFPDFLRQPQMIILEILQCIPAVIICVFLELEQIFSFVDGH